MEFLSDVLDDIDPTKGRVCDLFAGSGTVSAFLANHRPVTTVDIQEYSRVLCSAMLSDIPYSMSPAMFRAKVQDSQELKYLLEAGLPLIELESGAINLAISENSEPLAEFLEHSSIVSYEKGFFVSNDYNLKAAVASVSTSLIEANSNSSISSLITRHFGGIYFSFEQAAYLDAILIQVNSSPAKERDIYLAALLSTVSDIVNTVGKQFAQPLQPRTREGQPKNNLGKRVLKDRSNVVLDVYESWLRKYQSLSTSSFEHEIFRADFADALQNECNDFSVVYADPPYTRDHYSRFYHALETICLGDDPQVSTTKIGGRLRLSRGLYRQNRHQSPFCIRSQAPIAFETLFSAASKHGKPLVLSYSPYDETTESHPRVMTIESLMRIGENYYSNVETRVPGGLTHSKLNHSEKNFGKTEFGEILLIFK